MEIKPVDFDNYRKAIEIQKAIFPNEDGTINILASLGRDLFMKVTGLFYVDDNVKYYLAYIKNKPIGITGTYYYQKNEMWLAWFGILKEFRNKGYGKLLLEKTIEIAKNQNFKTFRLYTDKNENATAIKLYEKLGFIGEKYYTEVLPYDCYIYSKSLSKKSVELLGNRNLQLSYQYEIQTLDNEKLTEIINLYKNME